MSVLSDAQIIGLWLVSGGSISSAADALARALSESSGNTSVTSSNPDGGTNVGLYQLDTKGVGSGYSVAQLQNPYLNTQITVKATGNGSNWSAWADNWQNFISQAQSSVSSFQSSASGNLTSYAESLLTNVTTAGAGGSGQSATGGGSGSGLGLGDILSFPSDITSAFGELKTFIDAVMWLTHPGNLFRIGAFIGGTVLLFLGLYLLAKDSGMQIPKPNITPIPVPV